MFSCESKKGDGERIGLLKEGGGVKLGKIILVSPRTKIKKAELHLIKMSIDICFERVW